MCGNQYAGETLLKGMGAESLPLSGEKLPRNFGVG